MRPLIQAGVMLTLVVILFIFMALQTTVQLSHTTPSEETSHVSKVQTKTTRCGNPRSCSVGALYIPTAPKGCPQPNLGNTSPNDCWVPNIPSTIPS